MAETPLGRRTPLARPTLMIAANLPDIDATCMTLGRDMSLGLRRGHTHGLLAMVVLPLVLTGIVVAYDRAVRRPKGKDPVHRGGLLLLCVVGVLSHPLLDWLNNYGVRLLMPFSGRWFYGDAVFIADPWIWLLSGATVMWAHSRSKRGIAAWVVVGTLTSVPVFFVPFVPLAARIVWAIGLAGLIFVRVLGVPPHVLPKIATAALALISIYAAAMIAGSAFVRSEAKAWYARRGIDVQSIIVGPVPAHPLKRDVIGRSVDHYHFAEYDALAEPVFRKTDPRTPIGDGPIARRALRERPGLETWIRLPAFEVKALDERYEVHIRDVRYDRRGANLGRAVVTVPK